jgi:tripartite-type tricarboxylate transporter receptor subunit TctC
MRNLIRLWTAVISICGVAGAGHCRDDYFKGRTITTYVAFGIGGGYDQYGRLIARYLGRHIPGNPTVIVSNMPGANGIVAANFMYNVASRDGTAIGLLYQAIAQDQVLGLQHVQYDAAKFNWIGRITSNVEIMYAWHTVPIRTPHDLASRETILAVGGPAIALYAQILSDTVGARFKLVRGYPGTQEAHLALQRGEVEAAYSSINTIRTMWGSWLRDRLINIIVQTVPERHPELPDVPAIVELGRTVEERAAIAFFAASGAVGRSVVAPPEVPTERIETLRTAFAATVRDEQFLAEARQHGLDIDPLPASEVARMNERVVNIGSIERERVRSMATR